jgi:alkanesulfonate monooxygenase SsuD/methylene tetrahydromethanopterin reductase-like flavin-dependent oxidoreductase (luciferase family)
MAELMESARQLEDAGFDWIAVGDRFDALVTAAAVGTVTKRSTISSCVTLLTRTPVQAVSACGGLDDLTGGRFVLGLGVGPDEWNRDWHGLDPSKPARRMAEYIRSFKAAWDSKPGFPANVDGESYRVHNYVRSGQTASENFPVLTGVVGPLNTRNAARYGDGAIFDIELPLSYVESVGLPALEAGVQLAGKSRTDVTAGCLLGVSVDTDRSAARRRARHAILQHIPIHYYQPVYATAGFTAEASQAATALARNDLSAAIDAIPEEMVDALYLAGTADDVRPAFRRWSDTLDLIVAMSPRYQLPPAEVRWGQEQLMLFLTDEIGRT